MTYEQALNFNQKWTATQAFNDLERYLLRQEPPAMKAVALGMQALEKQMPQKCAVTTFEDEDEETGKKHTWIFNLCPACANNIALREYEFCPYCGQALKRGDKE